MLETICDVRGFLTDICEASPFLLVWVDICLSWFGFRGLCGFIGKDLFCRMLCIMLSSCWFRL